MKPLVIIVLLVFFGVLFHACPSEACVKKIRTLMRNKGKQNAKEKPAELDQDESLYIKYSHSQAASNNLFLEVDQNKNKSIVVRKLDDPPKIMSQVAADDLKERMNQSMTEASKPDIKSTEKPMLIDAIPPPHNSQNVIISGDGNDENEEDEEEQLSPEDANVRREWGGKCTNAEWNRCNRIRQIVVIDAINTTFHRENFEMDCLVQPILCLRNGWTANRCHILCMAAQCNKYLFFDWDSVVDFEGPCRYKK